jgi:Tfp pilus assembly protein PilX
MTDWRASAPDKRKNLMAKNIPVASRRFQHGAATLIVCAIFILISSLLLLYVNRGIVFEQKISANQTRSALALEMAEAGMEWATGMLNAPYDIDANCTLLTTTNISFRRKYVQTAWNHPTTPTTNVSPATTTYPGCKMVNGALSCSCPTAATPPASAVASLGTTVAPGFTVAFFASGDDEGVKVVATGCTEQAGACSPATSGSSDATVSVTAILKLRPLLRAAPAAPLTCGGSCSVGGSYNITNLDVGTSGVLVNAGSSITQQSGVTNTTIPGQPVDNAVISNDASLANLSSSDPTCSNSAMFRAYFGSSIQQYAASPMVKTIPGCEQANTCATLVDAAYGAGWRSFYFPDGFARNNSGGDLGTVSDPVTMVSAAGFDINGNIDIYGMVFSNSANINDLGTGSATVHGAMVACGNYQNNGNGTLQYDPDVLNAVRRATGAVVRVPGSWTDRCRISNTHPPVISCN